MGVALKFEGPNDSCMVPFDDAKVLQAELRRLNTGLYADAIIVAAWLDALVEEESRVTDQLKPGELRALDRALDGLAATLQITDPLRCLWNEVRASLSND